MPGSTGMTPKFLFPLGEIKMQTNPIIHPTAAEIRKPGTGEAGVRNSPVDTF